MIAWDRTADECPTCGHTPAAPVPAVPPDVEAARRYVLDEMGEPSCDSGCVEKLDAYAAAVRAQAVSDAVNALVYVLEPEGLPEGRAALLRALGGAA